jgi:hypothetical protein
MPEISTQTPPIYEIQELKEGVKSSFIEIEKLKKENEKLINQNTMDDSYRKNYLSAVGAKEHLDDFNDKLINENNKLCDHNSRLLRKMRRQEIKIRTMKEDWEDATKHLADQIVEKNAQIKKIKYIYEMREKKREKKMFGNPEPILKIKEEDREKYEMMFELGSFDVCEGMLNPEYKRCWQMKLNGQVKTFEEFVAIRKKEESFIDK